MLASWSMRSTKSWRLPRMTSSRRRRFDLPGDLRQLVERKHPHPHRRHYQPGQVQQPARDPAGPEAGVFARRGGGDRRAGRSVGGLIDMVAITDPEFAQFQRFIFESAGITLSPAKKALVSGRLARRLELNQSTSYGEYFRLLSSGR